MCTLILLDRIQPGVPLIVASNRDEYLSRPAAPPARIRPPTHPWMSVVAPQDLEAGGTWMGVNARGVFLGLTNRPARARSTGPKSRGLLVLETLGEPTARAALDRIEEEMRTNRYNPFHLLVADGRETWRVSHHVDDLETRRLRPGVHVLTNRDPEDAEDTKMRRVREGLGALEGPRPLPSVLSGLRDVLSTHAPPDRPLEGVCTHLAGYGTRSSGLLALGDRRWQFHYADGPPCETKYQDLTALTEQLRQA